jgi:hypothetical protein
MRWMGAGGEGGLDQQQEGLGVSQDISRGVGGRTVKDGHGIVSVKYFGQV